MIYYGQPVALVLHPELVMAQELAAYLREHAVMYESEHAVLSLDQAVAEKSFLPAAGDPGAGVHLYLAEGPDFCKQPQATFRRK